MRYYLLILLIFFTITIDSCSNRKKYSEESYPELVQIKWEDMEEKDMFYTDDILDSCRFLPLETNNDCLMGEILKIVIKGNFIFIKDNNKKIFVFNDSGKFMNTIGTIGPGPKEHLSIYDFYVNEEAEYVGLYDKLRGSITRYTYDGHFIKTVKCDPALEYSKYICGLNDGKLLHSIYNRLDNDYQYIVTNENDYTLSGEYLPYIYQGIISSSPWEQSYSTDGTHHYATALFSDTIYLFFDGMLYPRFVLQTPLKKTTKEDVARYEPFESCYDILPLLRKRGHSEGLNGVYAIQNYLHFTYLLGEDFYRVFWNIIENKGYRCLDKAPGNPLNHIPYIKTTTADAFVSFARAFEVTEARETLDDPNIFKQIESVKEEDNPVLVFYYITK